MKTKIFALIVLTLCVGLVASLSSNRVVRAADPQQAGMQELRERVSKLEKQIAELQKQVKGLETRRILTIPGSQFPQGAQTPPGSKQFKFNGQTYWFVPLQ